MSAFHIILVAPIKFVFWCMTGPDLIHIGHKYPQGWPLDRQPFLLETNVPGIFAAGGVRHGSMKRVAASVGDGSIAVQLIHQYLKKA